MSVKNLYPNVKPTLIEDFTQTQAFGPYTTFNRPSDGLNSGKAGMVPDITGELQYTTNQPLFDYDPFTHESLGLVRAGGDTQTKTNQANNQTAWPDDFFTGTYFNTQSVSKAADISGAEDIAGPGSRSKGYSTSDTEGTFVRSNVYHDNFDHEVSNLVNGSTYTFSIYAKSGIASGLGNDEEWLVLAVRDEDVSYLTHDNFYCFFNLSGNGGNGEIGTVAKGSGVIKKVHNGWYRISYTFTYDGTLDNNSPFNDLRLAVYPNRSADNTFSETSFGTTDTYFWGLTLTEGHHIAPYSASDFHDATVTMSHAEWWLQSEGTIIYETSINQYSSGIGTQERLEIPGVFKLESSGTGAPVFTATASSDTYTHGSAVTTMKEAIAYQANDVVYALNGSVVKTITSYTPPSVSADIKIADNMHGNLQKITYYPTRLTNAQIELLTS